MIEEALQRWLSCNEYAGDDSGLNPLSEIGKTLLIREKDQLQKELIPNECAYEPPAPRESIVSEARNQLARRDHLDRVNWCECLCSPLCP